MRKTYRAFGLAALLAVAFLAATAFAQDKPAFPSEFQYANNWKKLAPEVQKAWNDAKAAGTTDQRIECFVAVRSPGGMGDQDFLLRAGFATQVMAGGSARGHMFIKDLPNVAGQDFVRRIDLAKPVGE